MSKYSIGHHLQLKDFYDACEEIANAKEVVVDLIEENENLLKQLNEFKAEVYKDEELKRLKSENEVAKDSLIRGFPISEEEYKNIAAWTDGHQLKCRGKGGAIGGKYTFEFIPTGIGTVGTIKCACGKEYTFRELD